MSVLQNRRSEKNYRHTLVEPPTLSLEVPTPFVNVLEDITPADLEIDTAPESAGSRGDFNNREFWGNNTETHD